MTELAFVEISLSGFVTFVSKPSSSFWDNFLPVKGNDIFQFWDEPVNNQIKEFTQEVFNTSFQVKHSLTINTHNFNCTAFCSSTEKVTICFETMPLQKLDLFDDDRENRIELVNFAFKHANTAVQFLREDGSLFDFNEISNTQLGYTREEFFKLNIFDINPTLTAEGWKMIWNGLKDRGGRTINAQQKKKDGSWIDIEVKSTLINYKGIELNCAFINDITEKLKLEKTLIQEKSLLRTLIDTLPFPVFVKDEEGRKLIANKPDMELLMKVNSDERFVGKTDEEIFKDIPNNMGYAQDKRVLSTGKPIFEEFEVYHSPKGEEIQMLTTKMPIFDPLGNIKGLVGFCRDITEQKNLEEQLKLIGYSFENVDTAIYMVGEDGANYLSNKAMSTMLGYSLDEFMKLKIFDINPNINQERWEQIWNRQKEGTSNTVHEKLKRKDGFFIEVEIKAKNINYNGIDLSCAFITDITEKKQLEESLKLVDFAFRNSAMPMHFLNENGEVFDCNQAACNLLGYTREEYLALPILGINRNITIDDYKRNWATLTETSNRALQYKISLKNNQLIDVEIRSNKIQFGNQELMCSSFFDITEKKRTEQQLKMVDYAFRHASIAMQFLRKDGSIYDFNEKTTELLGYSKEEYKHIFLFDFSIRHTPETWNGRWEELKNSTDTAFVAKIKRKDNSLIDVEIRTDIIQYEHEELGFSTITDITEKLKTDQKLKIVDYAFKNASIPMHFLRRDGSVYDFNGNSPKLLGYTDEEFSKLNVIDFSTRHNSKTWEARWEEFKQGNKLSTITKMKRKDNSIIEVQIITDMVKYGNEELTFSSIIDLTEKNKTERKLNVVRYAFGNASIPMIFFRKDGSIFDFNEIAYNLLGYTEEEFKGISIFDISLRHNLETWEKRWDELTTNIHTSFLSRVRKKDGTVLDVEIRSDLFQYENEELNFSSIIDITEKKNAELELRRSNQRYENALLATSDVIWEADLIQNRIYYSKNFTLVFGHQVNDYQDLSNNSGRFNFHPDDVDRVNDTINDLMNGKYDKWDFEYRMKKADGNYAIVLDRGFSVKDEKGKVVRLVGAMQDITKKKAEETRLKLLESVAVHTNDAIVITEAEPFDEPGPKIIYVNDAYIKITGYSLEESIGTTPRRLQNNHTDRKELDKFKEALKKWQPAEMTVKNVRKNGEEFWANVRVTPVADEKGWFTHWISVQRDVTKEIESHIERESLLNELITHNTELKQFGYITTHNLRAPLTNLLSIGKMIDENKIEDNRTKKLISGFKESTLLLNDTLNDLINILFIKDRINLTTSELIFEDAFIKAKGLIANSIETKQVVISADFSLAPIVKFSPIYLESLFLNLLTNAIKYSHTERHPIIRISSEMLPDNRVKLIFSDNGLGMNMEKIRGKIFGLYQRFHDNFDSKGLGLYLVHSQVTALGGTIDVESEENEGTTFIITFKN